MAKENKAMAHFFFFFHWQEKIIAGKHFQSTRGQQKLNWTPRINIKYYFSWHSNGHLLSVLDVVVVSSIRL